MAGAVRAAARHGTGRGRFVRAALTTTWDRETHPADAGPRIEAELLEEGPGTAAPEGYVDIGLQVQRPAPEAIEYIRRCIAAFFRGPVAPNFPASMWSFRDRLLR